MQCMLIRVILSGVLQAIYAITMTRALTMRSNTAYYAIVAFFFVADTIMRSVGAASLFRTIIVGPFIWFGLPILLSTDGLRRRIARSAVIVLGTFLTEILASSIYTFIGNGDAVPSEIGPDNVSGVVTIYLLLIIASIIIYEATLAVFERIDGSYLSFVLPSAISFVGPSPACPWLTTRS